MPLKEALTIINARTGLIDFDGALSGWYLAEKAIEHFLCRLEEHAFAIGVNQPETAIFILPKAGIISTRSGPCNNQVSVTCFVYSIVFTQIGHFVSLQQCKIPYGIIIGP